MMAFHDVSLPARLAFGSTGGVERRTEVVTLGSGYERRSTPWADGRRRYLIGANLRSLDDMATLTAFFEARRG
ncbi:MAG: TIGR02217 family protein, partial [Brevundimonas sp.]